MWKVVTRYLQFWTLHMVHLSKLCCYSNRWLWVRLSFADVLKMERYSLFSFFLFLGQKWTLVEQSCTFQGHFSLTSCHVLIAKYSIFTRLFRILLTHYCINILHNLGPEIISMSSLTQQLFNYGYDKWLPSRNTWCRMFFPTKYYLKR